MKTKTREIFIVVVLIAVATAVWAVKNRTPNDDFGERVQIAKPATSETGKSADTPLAEALGVPLGKPVMVDFGSSWCQPCKIMAANMAEAEKTLGDKAVILFIDTDADRDLAIKAGINIIPTQIFFDPQGNEAGRNIGVLTPEDIVKFLTDGFPVKS